jgi:general secretion pathway protein N
LKVKRTILLVCLALLAFAVMLVIRLPASWVVGRLPPNVQCTPVSGTLWNGSCGSVVANGMQVGRLNWKLRPMKLLSGKLAAFVDLQRTDAFVRGEVESSFDQSEITLHDVDAALPIDPSIARQFPPNLRGRGTAKLQMLQMEQGIITAVRGRVEGRDLVQQYPIGSFAVTFAGNDGEPVGRIESLGGPLDVEGTLRLTREPGFAVEGTVAAGADVHPQLARQLEYLGSPDGQGRRPFSVAATF